jgi:RimJ/RimL family protein N-acetyltransferase
MEKILIFIKHHFNFLWRIIEWGNGVIFSLLFRSRMSGVLPGVFEEFTLSPYVYRRLHITDAPHLFDLIGSQEEKDLEYFSPHGFDLASIERQFSNPAFLMMGTFHEDRLVGYFFLRFFSNRKCFVGRLIDKPYRGRGVGRVMNQIMYETAWRMNFRCLSTISKNNRAVIKAHQKNQAMKVLRELNNDYLLVVFVSDEKGF